MKEKRINEIKGVVLVAVGLIVLASLVSFTPYDLGFYTSHPNFPAHNLIRSFGAYCAGILVFLFGWAAYTVPLCIFFVGVRLFRQDVPDLRLSRLVGLGVLLLSTSASIALINLNAGAKSFSYGGLAGYFLANFVTANFGRLGATIVFTALILLSFALVTEVLLSTLFKSTAEKAQGLMSPAKGLSLFGFGKKEKKLTVRPRFGRQEDDKDSNLGLTSEPKPKISIAAPTPAAHLKPPKIQIDKPDEKGQARPRPQEARTGDYHLPTLELLDSPPPLEARQIKDDLEYNARILQETLADFGIMVQVTDVERGPVITRYELEPAPGVKLNRIVALSDDIALAMKAPSVRIVAPIPGKARVGVEVPNTQSTFVYLKEIFESTEFIKAESKLTLAVGKDIAGHPVVTDLGDMPHLLIAGTTGSGKTVCVNSLIVSLLMRNTPGELKLLMVDPKMVELAPYNGLPHLICPVVTDAKKASVALNWVVSEMEERYQLLAKVGARTIDSYNQKQEKIPYIVVIIDEMADLMMIARDQIEGAITRLAQLSRAVGIHLIMATQRPSVDVVTGVIKANFPARISFKVASKVDSRTVLDMNGADKLVGKGDMLFLRPGEERLTRAQGALVKDNEIERMVEFIKAQGEPVYDEAVLKEQKGSAAGGGEKDELYDEAVRVVMESNQASVSILQRRMRLGYTRAARIIDQMEQEGMVGPYEGSKPRKILADREEWLSKSVMQQEERA